MDLEITQWRDKEQNRLHPHIQATDHLRHHSPQQFQYRQWSPAGPCPSLHKHEDSPHERRRQTIRCSPQSQFELNLSNRFKAHYLMSTWTMNSEKLQPPSWKYRLSEATNCQIQMSSKPKLITWGKSDEIWTDMGHTYRILSMWISTQ